MGPGCYNGHGSGGEHDRGDDSHHHTTMSPRHSRLVPVGRDQAVLASLNAKRAFETRKVVLPAPVTEFERLKVNKTRKRVREFACTRHLSAAHKERYDPNTVLKRSLKLQPHE